MPPYIMKIGAGDYVSLPAPLSEEIAMLSGWSSSGTHVRRRDGSWVFADLGNASDNTRRHPMSCVCQTNPLRLYIFLLEGTSPNTSNCLMFTSDDAGDTWTLAQATSQSSTPDDVESYPNNVGMVSPIEGTIYMNGDLSIWKTVNNGTTWQQIVEVDPFATLNDLDITSGKLWVGNTGSPSSGLWRCNLDGSSLEQVITMSGSNHIKVSALNDNIAIACDTNSGLWKYVSGVATDITPPSGAYSPAIFSAPVSILGCWAVDSQTFLALVTDSNSPTLPRLHRVWILRTTDGGTTWSTVYTKADYTLESGAVDRNMDGRRADRNRVYAVLDQPFVAGAPAEEQLLAHTSDGGVTWLDEGISSQFSTGAETVSPASARIRAG